MSRSSSLLGRERALAECLKVTREVVSYALDSDGDLPVLFFNTEVARIDEHVFFGEICADTVLASSFAKLNSVMVSGSKLAIVSGAAGSGKTTLLRKFIHSSTMEGPIVYVDLKADTQLADESIDDEAITQSIVHSELRKALLVQLQYEVWMVRDLVAWAVASAVGAEKHPDVNVTNAVADFHDDAVAIVARAEPSLEGPPCRSALYSAFEDPDLFEAARDRLYKRLRLKHVILYHSRVRAPGTTIRLLCDNVDRLGGRGRLCLLEILLSTQNAVTSSARVLASVRPESMRGFRAMRSGVDSDNVVEIAPDDKFYPDESLAGESAYSVIVNRSKFAQRAMAVHWAAEPASGEAGSRVDVQALWHDIGRSSQILSTLLKAADTPVLANRSLRQTGEMHLSFLEYIYRTAIATQDTGHGAPDVDRLLRNVAMGDGNIDVPKHLKTLFYMWLYEDGPGFGSTLDSVVDLARIDSATSFAEAASVRHLLVAAVHNLQPEEGPIELEGFPTVGDVFDALTARGFDEAAIRRVLRVTIADAKDPLGLLYFVGPEPRSVYDMGPGTIARVGISGRGRKLLTDAYSRIGYVWASIATKDEVRRVRVDPSGNAANAAHVYYMCSPMRRVAAVLEWCLRRCACHLRALALLREESRRGHLRPDGWLVEYRRAFSVSREFQIERIMGSAARFFEPTCRELRIDNPFTHLCQEYSSGLDQLVKSGDVCGFDTGDRMLSDLISEMEPT